MTRPPALAERAESGDGAARADDVIEQQDVVSLDTLDVRAVEAELLLAFRRDGDVLDPDGVLHIGFDGLARDDVAFLAEHLRERGGGHPFCAGRPESSGRRCMHERWS